MNVSFELVSKTPLLMHADDVDAADALSEWRKHEANKNVSKAGDDRSPPWSWHSCLYSDGEHLAFPGQNLMVCIRTAATRKIMKKQTTYKEVSQSGIVIGTEFMDFHCDGQRVPMTKIAAMHDMPFAKQAEAVKKLGMKLFVKRARIGSAKHIRVRPRFDKWNITGTLEVTAQEITFEVLESLFEIAGRVGLGDWRPGCKTPGPFGQFEAKVKRI